MPALSVVSTWPHDAHLVACNPGSPEAASLAQGVSPAPASGLRPRSLGQVAAGEAASCPGGPAGRPAKGQPAASPFQIVIPFFSLFIKDIYFLNEGCANRLPSGHVNFEVGSWSPCGLQASKSPQAGAPALNSWTKGSPRGVQPATHSRP